MSNSTKTARLMGKIEEWSKRHPLHSHPYLTFVFDERNDNIDAIKRFVEVLYVFCERFHDCLFELGANTDDEEIRRVIAYNLNDEFGAGNKDAAHLVLMRRLLYSVGYTDEDLANLSHSINPGAQQFMKEVLRYCREEPTLKALGCICIGAECNGSEYFRKIHDSFRKKPCMQGAELYILEIHAGDDIEHRSKMLRLIEPYLPDPMSSELLEQGYLDSCHLFQELWTSMLFYEDSIQYPTMAVAPPQLVAHP